MHLKGKVLFHVLDNHDEKGQFDAQRLLLVGRARDVCCAHVCAHNLNHKRLDVVVCDSLDVAIANLASL